ncbi:hypothetical protein MMC12_005904 [Toensbergia leucococca]|nr:hypothetical protein [Toensbergia leucococca]
MASSTILHPGPRDRYLPRFGVFKKRSQADRAMLGQSPMKREHPWQHHRRSVTDSMSPVSSFEAHSALQPKRWTCYLQKPEWPWLGPSGIPSLILCFKVQPPKENLATRDGTSPPLPKHPITAFPAVAETPHEMDGSSDEQELRVREFFELTNTSTNTRHSKNVAVLN